MPAAVETAIPGVQQQEVDFLPPLDVAYDGGKSSPLVVEPITPALHPVRRPTAEQTMAELQKTVIRNPQEMRDWLVENDIVRPVFRERLKYVPVITNAQLTERFGEERAESAARYVNNMYGFLSAEALIDGWSHSTELDAHQERERWRIGVESALGEKHMYLFQEAYTGYNQLKGNVMTGPIGGMQMFARFLRDSDPQLSEQIEEIKGRCMRKFHDGEGIIQRGNHYDQMDIADKIGVVQTLENAVVEVLNMIASPDALKEPMLIT